MNSDKSSIVSLRDKNNLTLKIATSKIKSEKYKSGGGTPDLLAKLSIRPKKFNIEVIGTPKQGMQAKVNFVRIRTESESVVEVVRKKEKGNIGDKNEFSMSNSIKENAAYDKIKTYLSLPFYQKKRCSGNEMYSRFKENGDLETYRECIQKNPSKAKTYLFHQTRSLVKALKFLHNENFKDEEGNKHKGIIHGDIAPDNIFVGKNRDLSLADFGCARYADEPIKQFGKFLYLSPELFRVYVNDVPKHPDKADIWSLGVTLQFMTTGEYPIEFSSQSAIISMSPTFSEAEKDTRDYLVRKTEQDVSYLKTDIEMSGYTMIKAKQVGDSAQEIGIKKADEYLQSEICRKNFESKKVIEDLCKNSANVSIDKDEIFHHLISTMLLPLEERPTAKELTETMDKLADYFPEQENTEFVEKMIASRVAAGTTLPSSLTENTIHTIALPENPGLNTELMKSEAVKKINSDPLTQKSNLEKVLSATPLILKEKEFLQEQTQQASKLSSTRASYKRLLDNKSLLSFYFYKPASNESDEMNEKKKSSKPIRIPS